MYDYSYDYAHCREIFFSFKKILKSYYLDVEKDTYPIQEECSVSSFMCENPNAKKLLLITTGEHGIEGYAGNVFLQLFVHEFLPNIKHDEVSLLLVHAINPWGMKHKRRVNKDNIDLNRNFLDFSSPDIDLRNESFEKMRKYFTNPKPVGKVDLNFFLNIVKLIPYIITLGSNGIKEALTKGQYTCERCVYYGGKQEMCCTQYMKALYRHVYSTYDFVLHLDIHTGAGPKNRMVIVNSIFDEQESREREVEFGYSPITKADRESFYEINGDMIDYIYKQYGGKSKFYTTCFEYGTLGDDLIGQLKSLIIVSLENRAWHYGTKN
ncbi:MAG TPA: M14 family metallopeptidase, partial [Fervidobacterium sp.]|nr:M14 family metallopeptidase [Fervidobacterium sp.]